MEKNDIRESNHFKDVPQIPLFCKTKSCKILFVSNSQKQIPQIFLIRPDTLKLVSQNFFSCQIAKINPAKVDLILINTEKVIIIYS